ncbi:MAG: hypothetical protein QOJ86_3347 [Bradyrhizobium sp.]|jgi:hypothetical protein|nr:hypothetical protein [Bradyrhizobium sp.]
MPKTVTSPLQKKLATMLVEQPGIMAQTPEAES